MGYKMVCGGFYKWGYPHSWMVEVNIPSKWMMPGGSPLGGNPHVICSSGSSGILLVKAIRICPNFHGFFLAPSKKPCKIGGGGSWCFSVFEYFTFTIQILGSQSWPMPILFTARLGMDTEYLEEEQLETSPDWDENDVDRWWKIQQCHCPNIMIPCFFDLEQTY